MVKIKVKLYNNTTIVTCRNFTFSKKKAIFFPDIHQEVALFGDTQLSSQ